MFFDNEDPMIGMFTHVAHYFVFALTVFFAVWLVFPLVQVVAYYHGLPAGHWTPAAMQRLGEAVAVCVTGLAAMFALRGRLLWTTWF